LHYAQRQHPGETSQLLLARGAALDRAGADGRTALHVAAGWGSLEGAFALCRFGADPLRKDAEGRMPRDFALASKPPADVAWTPAVDPAELADWLKPGGGCAEVATLARSNRTPVTEDDARRLFAQFACARGVAEACARK
jgi:hypothetical protein